MWSSRAKFDSAKSEQEFSTLKKANGILLKAIEEKQIRKFCDTRWNSRYDRMKELIVKIGRHSGDYEVLNRTML